MARLVDREGREVVVGDTVTDFRGKSGVLQFWRPPLHAGSTGRVVVLRESQCIPLRESFPSVYGLKIVD